MSANDDIAESEDRAEYVVANHKLQWFTTRLKADYIEIFKVKVCKGNFLYTLIINFVCRMVFCIQITSSVIKGSH